MVNLIVENKQQDPNLFFSPKERRWGPYFVEINHLFELLGLLVIQRQTRLRVSYQSTIVSLEPQIFRADWSINWKAKQSQETKLNLSLIYN